MQPFVVSLNELKDGKTAAKWRLDGKFFRDFESSEILDADLAVGISVEKAAGHISVDGTVSGTVTVSCDRCMADLVLPVDTDFFLDVRFSDGPADEPEDETGRETVTLPRTDTEFDLSQTLYDYVCLAIPLRRVHPEGGCDPEVTRYLGGAADAMASQKPSDSPFDSLKTLLKDK